MSHDYKDVDFRDLNYKEIQLLTLQELRGINDKISRLDRDLVNITKELGQLPILTMKVNTLDADLESKKKKIEELEKFKTQVTTAIIVINVIWGIVLGVIKFIV